MPTATRRSVGAQGHRTSELDNVIPFPARGRSGGNRLNADNPVEAMDYVNSEPDAPAPTKTPKTLTERRAPATGRTRGSDAQPPVSAKPTSPKKSKRRAPPLPTPRPQRCAAHGGSVVDTTHELARELCMVRWHLHCALGRLERVDEDRAVLATKIAKLRARDAQLVAELATVAPNDLALADATTMLWRSSPLGRWAESQLDRSAEAGVFEQLARLGVDVKGDR